MNNLSYTVECAVGVKCSRITNKKGDALGHASSGGNMVRMRRRRCFLSKVGSSHPVRSNTDAICVLNKLCFSVALEQHIASDRYYPRNE